MKKTLLIMLALFGAIKSYAYDVEVDGIYYNYLNENQVAVTHGPVYRGSINIPSSITVNGKYTYEVTTIERAAFQNDDDITSIYMADGGVKYIEDYAFSGCEGLTSVKFSNNLISIGDYGFSICSSLTAVNLPNSLRTIGIGAFRWCTSLQTITIPNGVTSIENETFSNCFGLKSVSIPETVTSIASSAFYGCSQLNSVTVNWAIPLTITKNVFSNQANATLYVPAGCKEAYQAADYWKEFKTIKEFGPIIFADWRVKTLCVYYWDTNGDGEIDLEEAQNVTDLGDVFKERPQITSFNELRLFTKLTSIGDYAFSGCSGLTSINIPDGVTSIGEFSFSGCSALTSITFPFNVKSIGGNAFNGCSSLRSVTIMPPKYLSTLKARRPISITENTFTNRANATLYLPARASTIEEYAHADYWKEFKTIRGFGSIFFTDTNVKKICVDNWDTDNDGELSVNEAQAAYFLNGVFKNNTQISSFDELCFFTGLTSIEDNAFNGCSNLKSVTIPDNIQTIGSGAFSGSNLRLVKVNMDCGIPITPASAFSNKYNITLIVPFGRKADYKVLECWRDFKLILEKEENDFITFADSNVEALCVKNWDFDSDELLTIAEACSVNNLGNVFKSKVMTTFNELQLFSQLESIGNEAFYNCKSLTSISIPESVTSIGSSAFRDCSGLTSISIPENVTSIGSSAFRDCSGLTSVTLPESVTSIGDYAFSGCSGLTSISIPENVTSISSYAFNYCFRLISISIPESVTSIGSSAFRDCSGLTSVTIPESVTSIGDYAFDGCSGLTSVTIPESVTSIGILVFGHCSSLESIVVERNNTTYDSRNNCNAIIKTATNELITGCKNTTIPESVTSIGSSAFYGCSSLTSISIPESVTSIGQNAFSGCSGLTSISIPESVTSISSFAFSGCSGLTSISIPESVTSIGSSAFSGCSSLTSISIPEGVTSVGSYAFQRCSGLTSVTIPGSITSISDHSFDGCSGLTSVTIPESVTSIGSSAFSGCSGLTSVTIPESVTSIGSSAFSGCSCLIEVTVDIFMPLSISSSTFSNRTNATLYVPAGSRATYLEANYWKEFKEIIEFASVNHGDINGDKLINVGDIMGIINMIVGTTQITDAADINGDGDVNVGDIMAIINIIIANANNNAKTMIPTNMPNNDFLSVRKEDGIIGINLDNQFAYGAFQMKVMLPDGGRIESVEFNDDRLDGFVKCVRKTDEGQYVIIGYSMDSEIVEGFEGEMLKIHTSGCTIDDVHIYEAFFSTPSSTTYQLPVMGNESSSIKNIQTGKMWVEGNTVYVNNIHEQMLNVFLFNGGLFKTIHLHDGLNSFILPQGQYIINHQKILIK